jgi:hypothetical protein
MLKGTVQITFDFAPISALSFRPVEHKVSGELLPADNLGGFGDDVGAAFDDSV